MKRKRSSSKSKSKAKKKKFSQSEKNVERGLYSLRDDVILHPELVKYDNNPFMRKIGHNGKTHTMPTGEDGGKYTTRPGLVKTLQRRFYHKYKDSKRSQKTIKKGAGKTVGKTAHDHIEKAVQNEGMEPPRCSKYAKAVLAWWKKMGHELQGSELPVHMERNRVITRGDFFTVKKEGTLSGEPELWYWELKCGWPPGADTKKGKMNRPLDHVDCTKFNIYELQRQWTHWAYEEELGMKIHASRVLHVYDHEGKGMVVEARPIPSWCKGLSREKHYDLLK